MERKLSLLKINKLVILYIGLILITSFLGWIVFFANPYLPNLNFPHLLHKVLEGSTTLIIFLIFLRSIRLYFKTSDKRMAIIGGACLIGTFLNLYNVITATSFPYDILDIESLQKPPELFYLLVGKLVISSSFLISVFYSAKSSQIKLNFVRKTYIVYLVILLFVIFIYNFIFPNFSEHSKYITLLLEKNFGILDEIFCFLAVLIFLSIEKPKSRKVFWIFIAGVFIIGVSEIFYVNPFLIPLYGITAHVLKLIGFLMVLIGIGGLQGNPEIVSFRQKISGYLSLFLVFSYIIFSSLFIVIEGIDLPAYFPFIFYEFVLVTTVFQYITSKKFIQPVVNIIDRIDKFNPNEKLSKIAISSNDEIGLLTDKLNKITDLYWEHLQGLRKKQDEETFLRRIIETIRSTFDLESIKHEIVTQTGLLLKADRVFFADYDPNTKKYDVSSEREYRSSYKVKSFAGYDFTATPGFVKYIREKHLQGKDIIFSDLEKYLDENNLRGTEIEKFYREFGFISSAAINIYYGKMFLGDLVITFEKQRDITEDDINLIKTIANQSGVAIYQSNLYKTIKKQVENENLLRKIINNILTSENLDSALNLICKEIGKLFDAERVKIRNFNQEENAFSEVVTEYRKNEQIPSSLGKTESYPMEMSQYFLDLFIKEKKYFIVNDFEKEEVLEQVKEFSKKISTKSVIVSPVFYKNQLIANIVIENITSPKEWDQEKLDLLIPVCQQIAIGMNLFNFNEKLKKSLVNEKIIREVIIETSKFNNHDEIFNCLLNQLINLFNPNRCIHLHNDINNNLIVVNEVLKSQNLQPLLNQTILSYDYTKELLPEKSSQIKVIKDVEQEISTSELKEFLIQNNIRSYLIYSTVRIGMNKGENEVLGYTVICYPDPKIFSLDEIDFFKLIVEAISIVFLEFKQREEKEEIKQTFIATLTHDLRSPILAEQKALEGIISNKIRCSSEYLEDIYKTNEELLKIVNNLLSVYHYESGKPVLNKTQTAIKDLIEESVRALKYLAQDKESQIYSDIQENLPLINVDKDEINRVISNLIGNAIKHTRKGTQIKVSAIKTDNNIQVAIQDNGEGIPKENLHVIFQRYPTEKRKVGTGLGLYLSKQIIEAHEGKIWFETKEGVGTTFYFTLPI